MQGRVGGRAVALGNLAMMDGLDDGVDDDDSAFGVGVAGADSYDSYCYPGGLNQQLINDL